MNEPLTDDALRRIEVEENREDIPLLVAEIRRLREETGDAVRREREACARIAENHLNQLYHAHGASGERMIVAILEEIEERGEAAEGTGEGAES
jgi:hypothetical protein